MNIRQWASRNKLVSIAAIVVIAYFAIQIINSFSKIRPLSMAIPQTEKSLSGSAGVSQNFGAASEGISLPSYRPPSEDYAPAPDVQNRLVIQESYLSLLVKDVVEVRNKILEFTNANGGYMVNANTSNPQDAPTATITVRIPSDKLQTALDYYHSLSIKVVSENLTGRDVTDQYVDIDARLKTLESTKARYESILAQAVEIKDITSLTQQILSVQSQIDSLKGQQKSLEQNAALAKLTIYLSTDELALPYAPSETFRPAVIFKLAVRSLIGFARSVATMVIWLGVYSVIWIPVVVIIWFFRKRNKKPPTPPNMAN